MSSIKSILVAASLLGILAACSSPTVRMGDEPPADIDRAAGRPISASACGYQLLGLIPIASNGRRGKARMCAVAFAARSAAAKRSTTKPARASRCS